MNHTKTENLAFSKMPKYYICTAPSDTPKTGDVDFAASLVSTLVKKGKEAEHIKDRNLTGQEIVAKLVEENKKRPVVLHLMINADVTHSMTTGATIHKEHLQVLKNEGIPIIITCIEYAKGTISSQPVIVNLWNEYFQYALRVCFVDGNDKNIAISKSDVIESKNDQKEVPVVPIPTTIKMDFDALPDITKRPPGNFLCFGMIRSAKGIKGVVLGLAKEFRNQTGEEGKYVYLVGSIAEDEKSDPRLIAHIFLESYGKSDGVQDYIKKILHSDIPKSEKVKQLKDYYNRKLISLTPDINIKFFIDVPENQLSRIFSLCRYALNFHYKGVSTHFSGVTNTFSAKMKNYGFDGNSTPDYFRSNGEFSSLVKLFNGQHGKSHTIMAQQIIQDVEQLEEKDSPQLEQFCKGLNQFYKKYPFDIGSVSDIYENIYTEAIQEARNLSDKLIDASPTVNNTNTDEKKDKVPQSLLFKKEPVNNDSKPSPMEVLGKKVWTLKNVLHTEKHDLLREKEELLKANAEDTRVWHDYVKEGSNLPRLGIGINGQSGRPAFATKNYLIIFKEDFMLEARNKNNDEYNVLTGDDFSDAVEEVYDLYNQYYNPTPESENESSCSVS